MKRALGISPHTGWAACVVIDAAASRPVVIANTVVDVLGDDQRFCYHMAAGMKPGEAARFLDGVRAKALANAKEVLQPLLADDVRCCAIVARDGDAGPLEHVLAAHPRIHTAEGFFYRDVFRAACGVPVTLVAPKSLDIAKVGKLAAPPWGRDQKMATLAAWSAARA